MADRVGSASAIAPARNLAVDQPDAVSVSTGTFGIVQAGHTKANVLQTSGAGPCVVIAMHDANGVGALAHLHPSQDPVASTRLMLAMARRAGLDPASTRVHLIGGMDDDREFVDSVVRAVEDTGLNIVERALSGRGVRNVQMDAATGQVARYRETGNDRAPTPNDGRIARLQIDRRAWRP